MWYTVNEYAFIVFIPCVCRVTAPCAGSLLPVQGHCSLGNGTANWSATWHCGWLGHGVVFSTWKMDTKLRNWCSELYFFYLNHHLSIVEHWPSSWLFTGCVVPLRGDWAIFSHAGSGRVGWVWPAREKSLELHCHGWELNPGQREDRQWDSFILPLSYHDPATERTDSEIHSFSRWAIVTVINHFKWTKLIQGLSSCRHCLIFKDLNPGIARCMYTSSTF